MKFELEVLKFDADVVVTSGGGSCSIKGQLVEECDFE